MTDEEVYALTARLRQAQPRNLDTLALCDWADRAVFEARVHVAPTQSAVPTRGEAGCKTCAKRRGARAQKARRWRAQVKRRSTGTGR
jgi:hypothetical protein